MMTKERLERIITNRDSGGAYSDMQTHEAQLNHLLDLQSILPNVLDSGAHLASCESFDHLRKQLTHVEGVSKEGFALPCHSVCLYSTALLTFARYYRSP